MVSIFTWGADSSVATFLAFSTTNVLAGRIWTVVTALFIHANLAHLVGNMLFLYVFGNTLENVVSGRNVLIAFFAGGIATSILSMPFYPIDTLLVGASAAIFTLAAAVMLIKPYKFSWLFLLPTGLVAIIYFLYNVVAVYRGFSGEVAYISHVIGFLIGIPIGISWSPRWMRNLVVTLVLLVTYLIMIVFTAPTILEVVDKTLTLDLSSPTNIK